MGLLLRLRRWLRPGVIRLADGTPARVGMRVVYIREVLEGYGLGHAWDDQVRTITALLPLPCRDGGMVELGPRQAWGSYLRPAPRRNRRSA